MIVGSILLGVAYTFLVVTLGRISGTSKSGVFLIWLGGLCFLGLILGGLFFIQGG